MSDQSTALVPAAVTAFAPRSVDEAHRLAETLAKSKLIPSAYQGRPDDVLVALILGYELGLAPMQSLRLVHVVQGKPVMSADLAVALVKRSPVCRYFQLVEATPTRCTIETHRHGEPQPVRMSWTMEDAKRAGLAQKDNWKSYPQAMLRARVSMDLARAVYPDVVAGVYDPDELPQGGRDGRTIDVEPVVIQPPPPEEPEPPRQTGATTTAPGKAEPNPWTAKIDAGLKTIRKHELTDAQQDTATDLGLRLDAGEASEALYAEVVALYRAVHGAGNGHAASNGHATPTVDPLARQRAEVVVALGQAYEALGGDRGALPTPEAIAAARTGGELARLLGEIEKAVGP